MWGDLYIELLKRTLIGYIYQDPAMSVAWRPESVFDPRRRMEGKDWPMHAHTMIGLKRLNNLHHCVRTVIDEEVPGDLIETGVWRGGACIFMRGLLKSYGVDDRIVYAADSFCGFPTELDRHDDRILASQPDQALLAVPLEEVKANFERYGLLDGQVQFIEGWFSDTLPGPVKSLSVLRLDGDLYRSTMESLMALYPLLSPGGFCIIDDWNVPMCRQAVGHYREALDIYEPIQAIDECGVFWRKTS